MLSLAIAYADATGVRLETLGSKIANNHKLFTRLAENAGCSAKAAECATRWFIDNWPSDVPWPPDVPDLCSERVMESGRDYPLRDSDSR